VNWVAAIPLLPALAFACLIALPGKLRNRALWLPLAATSTSMLLALFAFARVWPGGGEGEGLPEAVWSLKWSLAEVGTKSFELGLRLDPVSAIMIVVVTIVATCVQVYSLSYMKDDKREGWYYAVLSLFTAAMLGLVLSDGLFLVFAMWEIMGLSSYLLIGFWYELEAPRKASQKAFLTTGVGDLGFLVALFVIYKAVGTWELAEVLGSVHSWGPGVAAAAAVGLLLAAMGKSAQVPLHVWLPDAMAGPTPASALIHAATMVAAGVYLVARTLPIFEAAPAVLHAALIIGAITAFVGSLLACVQHDVKKVLAYSTISQLGIMFMALGAGSAVAALFHLVTHAFFKSLLFLGAGVIIHSAHTQDMREMGGLRRYMPYTWATLLVGSLALAGVIPFSGFFSKDGVVAALIRAEQYWAVAVLLSASALTAFYMARLYFRVFEGPAQTENLHEPSPLMLGPMIVLAAITTVLGAAGTVFAVFLGHEGEWPTPVLIMMTTTVAVIGIGTGWWFYGRRTAVVNTRVLKMRMGLFYSALRQNLYFDAVYQALIIHPYMRAADLLAVVDSRVIDGVVNALGRGWMLGSDWASRFDKSVVDGVVRGFGVVGLAASGVTAAFDRSVVDSAVERVGDSVTGTGSLVRRMLTGNVQTYLLLFAASILALVLVFAR
jgi:NADH-quinone oxidoreductase subunit L